MQFIDLTHSGEQIVKITEPGDTVLFVYNASKKISVDLEVEGAHAYIFGVFVGTGAESFFLETTQHHVAPGATSDLFVKGIFKDQSQFTYEGLIRIEEGAQKSAAYQKNQNIMLSKEAKVHARPFLEILANDVFCTHGATTGRLNAEQVMYLQARGIERARAESILAEGFVGQIFQKLEAHGIVKEVAEYKKDALQRIYV
jgi:Fe-S cluster assembly protein SufD